MWLVDVLYKIGSLLKCSGKHDFKPKMVFVLDPAGPEYTEFFGGQHGRTETFGRCSRCTLRDDGKGFDY